MFRAEPWARAFIKSAALSGSALSGDAASGAALSALEYLKVFCRATLSLPGVLSGKNDADRLGKVIAASLERAGLKNGEGEAALLAARFIQLMLRRKCFNRQRRIILEIEKLVNKSLGIEEVVVETAAPPGEALLRAVKDKAAELTGAREVRLTARIIPELIGGVRLWTGGKLFDSSLKTKLQQMSADLGSLRFDKGLEA